MVSTYYDSETVKELFLWLQDLPKEDHVAIAIRCARSVLHLVSEGDLRPLKAIEAAEAWLAEPSDAAAAAAAAAWAADAAAAAAGAAWAAWAAAAAAWAADAAAGAPWAGGAWGAAGAAAWAGGAAGAADHEKDICNLIRSVLSERYSEKQLAVMMAAKRLQGVGA